MTAGVEGGGSWGPPSSIQASVNRLDLQNVRSIIERVTTQFVPRLARAERMILQLLVEHGDLFGLALVNASGGRLSRGGIYVTLGRMEEKGLLTSRQEAPAPGAIGLPRRLYTPTSYARRVLDAWTVAAASFERASRLREQPS